MKIGQIAKSTGTKVETIRYYESIGLLPEPARTQSNYRDYGSDHLARLSFVRRARGLGFSLDEVRDLLALADNPDQPCNEVDELARGHLAAIEAKIADLSKLRATLADLVDSCSHGSVEECRVIEALAP